VGELAKRGGKPYFIPCTPKGVMVLLEQSKVDLKGKRAVVLGRSDIVGKPVSYLLEKADATVTVCHSKTANIKEIVLPKLTCDDCRSKRPIFSSLRSEYRITFKETGLSLARSLLTLESTISQIPPKRLVNVS
jgi:hypothetical protein